MKTKPVIYLQGNSREACTFAVRCLVSRIAFLQLPLRSKKMVQILKTMFMQFKILVVANEDSELFNYY